jgi:Fe-Mn family superoxide dismutase
MTIKLPPLPYATDALAPFLSEETLNFHYGKHHQAYVTNLNSLIKGTNFEALPLETIIKESTGAMFNNAAQVWNHSFYWSCLRPANGPAPCGALADALSGTFGSIDAFKDAFTKSALGNFGSGWTWLVKGKKGVLEIVNTSNAGTPITDGKQALLTCDVWEHAYYIDYRNLRAEYLETFWAYVNWEFVAESFSVESPAKKPVKPRAKK